MANNGNYRIEIGVSKSGFCTIGASSVNHLAKNDDLADSERVYGIQIGHRVAAKTEKGWLIMTPTDAKNMDTQKLGIFHLLLGEKSRG
jgi:hypothetical protein